MAHSPPRPSRRAELDEDSRSAALIYRDVTEYVVGHTCSARAILSSTDDGIIGVHKDGVDPISYSA